MEHAKSGAFRGALSQLVRAAAYAYPLSLLALCAALSGVGERHWLTAGLLYVPRALFALPLVPLLPALWLIGPRRLLWTQAAALLLTLFPLMGLVLPWPTRAPPGPRLRVLSYNVDTARGGSDRLLGVVDRLAPDLVLFQESPWHGPLHDGLRARFAHFDHIEQFVTASRFPILERTSPPEPPASAGPYLQRFVRYLVDTPLGKVAVYSLHPLSPRGTIDRARLADLLHGRAPGDGGSGNPESVLGRNAAMREAQLAQATVMARRERYPVLLAGDTNLPGSSRALRVLAGGYTDGFRRASFGFGYTFPARRPFLRLDRILAGPELDFSAFRVGCPDASDHCWVSAELFRR